MGGGSEGVALVGRVKLDYVQAFEHHLAVHERSNGLQTITVYELPADGHPPKELGEGRK